MSFNIKINFDYFYKLSPSGLFDPNTPQGQQARKTVEKAASDWASYISSDFVKLPQGTVVKIADAQSSQFPNAKIPVPIPDPDQDITIFVGARPIAWPNLAQTSTGDVPKPQSISSGDSNDYDFLNAARNGINRQPSVGSISFNSDPKFGPNSQSQYSYQVDYNAPVANTEYDLYTVALHEIFHLLAAESNGFYYANSAPALAFDVNLKQGAFSGINATSVVPAANGRKVVGDHFVASTMSPPVGGGTLIPELIVPSYTNGDRKSISQLDLAVLADVGYSIINAGFTPKPISLTAPAPFLLVPGYAVAGTKQDDNIVGNTGDDSLAGGPGNDTLNGGAGEDSLYGGKGNDSIVGGTGDDSIVGGEGIDSMYGGKGNDTFFVDDINDLVVENPNEGNDRIIINAPKGDTSIFDSFTDPQSPNYSSTKRQHIERILDPNNQKYASSNKGENIDVIALVASSPISISSSSNWEILAFEGNDTIVGNSGNDTLVGDAGSDALSGELGNDSLIGGKGADTLQGGQGADFLDGGDGNDSIIGGTGIDTMYGGKGNDTFFVDNINDQVFSNPNEGQDWIVTDVSKGDMTVFNFFSNLTNRPNIEQVIDPNNQKYASSNKSENIDLATIISLFPTVSSSNWEVFSFGGNDTIAGTNGNETIHGGAGNDNITGGSGSDYLIGDAGNDTLYANSGLDTLSGSSIDVLGANERDVLYGSSDGNKRFFIGSGSNVWYSTAGDQDYVLIQNFKEGDTFEYAGSPANYTVSQVGNDIAINYNNDLISTIGNFSNTNYIKQLLGITAPTPTPTPVPTPTPAPTPTPVPTPTPASSNKVVVELKRQNHNAFGDATYIFNGGVFTSPVSMVYGDWVLHGESDELKFDPAIGQPVLAHFKGYSRTTKLLSDGILYDVGGIYYTPSNSPFVDKYMVTDGGGETRQESSLPYYNGYSYISINNIIPI